MYLRTTYGLYLLRLCLGNISWWWRRAVASARRVCAEIWSARAPRRRRRVQHTSGSCTNSRRRTPPTWSACGSHTARWWLSSRRSTRRSSSNCAPRSRRTSRHSLSRWTPREFAFDASVEYSTRIANLWHLFCITETCRHYSVSWEWIRINCTRFRATSRRSSRLKSTRCSRRSTLKSDNSEARYLRFVFIKLSRNQIFINFS